jgi:hypothetical protein
MAERHIAKAEISQGGSRYEEYRDFFGQIAPIRILPPCSQRFANWSTITKEDRPGQFHQTVEVLSVVHRSTLGEFLASQLASS